MTFVSTDIDEASILDEGYKVNTKRKYISKKKKQKDGEVKPKPKKTPKKKKSDKEEGETSTIKHKKFDVDKTLQELTGNRNLEKKYSSLN